MRIRSILTTLGALSATCIVLATPAPSAEALGGIPLTPVVLDPGQNQKAVSDDGRWILGLGNGSSTPLRDWLNNTSTQISGYAYAMSSDARYVATVTTANLDGADTSGGTFDLYRYDRVTDTYTFVTAPPAGYSIQAPLAIADSGTFIAYTAVEAVANGQRKVWTVDLGAAPVAQSNQGLTSYPVNEVQDVTPDGRYLLYRTSCRPPTCPSLGQGEIRRYDRLTNTTKRVSVNNSGVESNGGDALASLSPSGRYVTWQSAATNLGLANPDTGAWYVRDTVSNVTTVLGSAFGIPGSPQTGDSGVAIYPGLVDVNGSLWETVYARELATGQIRNLLTDVLGQAATGNNRLLAVSANGGQVLMYSPHTLIPGRITTIYIATIIGGPVQLPSNNRVMDTRFAVGVPTTTPIPAGTEVTVNVLGVGDVDEQSTGVWVNVGIVQPATKGYAKLYPCDDDPGLVSTINFVPGGATANLAMVKLSAAGTICMWANATAHMLIDVQREVHDYTAIAPVRLMDTRLPAEAPTPLTSMEVRSLHVTGANGVVEGTQGVALNVTIINPSKLGYLQAFTCGTTPVASNGNFFSGRTKAAFVLVKPDLNGDVCFLINASADMAVDLVGHLPTSTSFVPSGGVRLLGQDVWLTGGRVIRLDTLDGIGPYVAFIGLVAVQPSANGYVTAYRCDLPMPQVSALNFVPGGNTSNVTLVDVNFDGEFCLYVSQDVRLVVDYYGRST
ncbi:MAG: hypothetical protein KDB06_03655 [Ilumatobacter sp.]|nr:hypothetical protein [Ilumatobacter sp.]MCB0983726.1 hypothetical protein [Ilumatobacter sp.]